MLKKSQQNAGHGPLALIQLVYSDVIDFFSVSNLQGDVLFKPTKHTVIYFLHFDIATLENPFRKNYTELCGVVCI